MAYKNRYNDNTNVLTVVLKQKGELSMRSRWEAFSSI
jgi:hypothetical protein